MKVLSGSRSVRRITVLNTGQRWRSSASPCRTASLLCHWQISIPAILIAALACRILATWATMSPTPISEKPSTTVGITTSSEAIRAAQLAAVKPGGQSKIM